MPPKKKKTSSGQSLPLKKRRIEVDVELPQSTDDDLDNQAEALFDSDGVAEDSDGVAEDNDVIGSENCSPKKTKSPKMAAKTAVKQEIQQLKKENAKLKLENNRLKKQLTRSRTVEKRQADEIEQLRDENFQLRVDVDSLSPPAKKKPKKSSRQPPPHKKWHSGKRKVGNSAHLMAWRLGREYKTGQVKRVKRNKILQHFPSLKVVTFANEMGSDIRSEGAIIIPPKAVEAAKKKAKETVSTMTATNTSEETAELLGTKFGKMMIEVSSMCSMLTTLFWKDISPPIYHNGWKVYRPHMVDKMSVRDILALQPVYFQASYQAASDSFKANKYLAALESTGVAKEKVEEDGRLLLLRALDAVHHNARTRAGRQALGGNSMNMGVRLSDECLNDPPEVEVQEDEMLGTTPEKHVGEPCPPLTSKEAGYPGTGPTLLRYPVLGRLYPDIDSGDEGEEEGDSRSSEGGDGDDDDVGGGNVGGSSVGDGNLGDGEEEEEAGGDEDAVEEKGGDGDDEAGGEEDDVEDGEITADAISQNEQLKSDLWALLTACKEKANDTTDRLWLFGPGNLNTDQIKNQLHRYSAGIQETVLQKSGLPGNFLE